MPSINVAGIARKSIGLSVQAERCASIEPGNMF